MKLEEPFRDRAEEEAKQPWTWPRAIAKIGTGLIFWTAVVAIVYVLARYG